LIPRHAVGLAACRLVRATSPAVDRLLSESTARCGPARLAGAATGRTRSAAGGRTVGGEGCRGLPAAAAPSMGRILLAIRAGEE